MASERLTTYARPRLSDGRMILGNGRMVSKWPARGGPAVADGVVYFAAGIWPADGVYLYALEADTGKEVWSNKAAGALRRGHPHAGSFKAFREPELPDVEYSSRFLGEAMIVDADGAVLARKGRQEGAGFVIADLTIPDMPKPSEELPDRFWLPPELPVEWTASWERWFAKGTDYYEFVTRPFIKTGSIKEYEPPYFRN